MSSESVHGVVRGQLLSVVERVERLEANKAEVSDAIKAVYVEAKANGFDTKTLRPIVRRRQMSADDRAEADALLSMYESALGMQPELPGIGRDDGHTMSVAPETSDEMEPA